MSDAKEDLRFRVLRLLENNPNLSQRQIAQALGVSVGRANYCLKAVTEVGFIKVKNFRNSQNKLAYAYTLTPKGIAEKTALTMRFLKRKTHEYNALKHEIKSLKKEIKNPEKHSAQIQKQDAQ